MRGPCLPTGRCLSATWSGATRSTVTGSWSASCPSRAPLARRYQRTGEPFDDLFQVACLGLVKAIDRFDLSRDVAFSSYAVPTILGEIRRYLRDRTWSVRVPRGLQELALRVDKNVVELSGDLHRQPTVAEIARRRRGHRGAGARGAAGLRCLPRDVASDPARHRGRGRRHARRHARQHRARASGWPRTAPRSPSCCARSPRASARCCACASRRTSPNDEIGRRIGVSQMQTSRIIRHSIARLRTAAHA